MKKTVILAIITCLALSTGHAWARPDHADRPEWIARPKSSDRIYLYVVGHAAGKASEDEARAAAFQNALEQLARQATPPDGSSVPSTRIRRAEIVPGCLYTESSRAGYAAWVQVSWPTAEQAKILKPVDLGTGGLRGLTDQNATSPGRDDAGASSSLVSQAAVMVPPGVHTADDPPRIRVDPSPPLPPPGFATLGVVYEITPPKSAGTAACPVWVVLPLANPAITNDRAQGVFVGLFHNAEWEVVPGWVEGQSVAAQFDRFSRAAVLTAPVARDPSDEDLARATYNLPSLWGIRVGGDRAYLLIDASCSRYLKIMSGRITTGRAGWAPRLVNCDRFSVWISRPAAGRTLASPATNAFRRLQVDGQAVVLDAVRGLNIIPLDFSAEPMNVSGNDTVHTAYAWRLKFRPLLADGREGSWSDQMIVPAGAADAQLRLRRGILARLGGMSAPAIEFERRTIATIFILFVNPAFGGNAYGFPSGVIQSWFSGVCRGTLWGTIGLDLNDPQCTYDRVVAHEWGHYVVHAVMGDKYFSSLGSGAHKGWREAATRSLAWSEDLATFFGQYGTEAGVPARAGAMRGNWERFSRDPAGEDDANLCWPNNRNQDATRVECIPATILSRLARSPAVGFAQVYRAIIEKKPADIVDFFLKFTEDSKDDRTAACQAIYVDEGVAWRVQGRVIKESPEAPLPDVRVSVLALSGQVLLSTNTGPNGVFEVRLPPGDVRLKLEKEGWEQPVPVDLALAWNQLKASTLDLQNLPKPLIMEPKTARYLRVCVWDKESNTIGRSRVEVRRGETLVTNVPAPGGQADLWLDAGTYALTASALGFKSNSKTVTLGEQQENTAFIVLAKAPEGEEVDHDTYERRAEQVRGWWDTPFGLLYVKRQPVRLPSHFGSFQRNGKKVGHFRGNVCPKNEEQGFVFRFELELPDGSGKETHGKGGLTSLSETRLEGKWWPWDKENEVKPFVATRARAPNASP